MNDYDRIAEVAELAKKTVQNVMAKGQKDGKRGWEDWAPEEHAQRALRHIENVIRVTKSSYPLTSVRKNLDHALTRITMMLYLLDAHSDSDRGDKE